MRFLILKRLGLGVGALLLVLGAYLAGLQLTGNFHEVLPGQLYRSAQPSAAQISRYVHDYGIKTIVNLRGSSKASWYKDEIAETNGLGINHIDFKMSSSKEISADETYRLIALLRDAPKPILIHCKAGADRTGLVSVIYLQQLAGVDEESAEWQLSLLYGHLGIPYLSVTFAMDENWEHLEKIFGLPS